MLQYFIVKTEKQIKRVLMVYDRVFMVLSIKMTVTYTYIKQAQSNIKIPLVSFFLTT